MQNNTKIIDCHVHIFPDAIADKAVQKLAVISGLIPYTNGTLADTKEKLKLSGVDGCLLLNIATSPKQNTTINNTAQSICETEKQMLALGSVHFEADDALLELERVKDMGLKGIKLHPDYQGFMINDERLDEFYDKCSQLDLPVVFHSGWDCYSPDLIHAEPEMSAQVIKRFPKLKMILAHFGGLKQWDEVEKNLIGKNVWFDTAMCATYSDKKTITNLINKHDCEKIFFGSDCPWENPTDTFNFLNSLEISDDKKEKIFSQNAMSFFDFNF